MQSDARHRIALLAGALAVAVLALPVLAGVLPESPAPPVMPAASPTGSGDPGDKTGRGPKAERARVATTPVTLTGRLGTRSDDDGRPEYTLTVGGTVYVLHVGPPWWWGDRNPLAARVGDTVTIEGDRVDGTNDVEVTSVNGSTVREAGRPPWAGGPKAVGERHPGWSEWKEIKRAERGDREPGPPEWARPKASPSMAP